MASPNPCENLQTAYEATIGYLNFSAGAFDANFFRSLDRLYAELPTELGQPKSGLGLRQSLSEGIASLRGSSPAFSDTTQAERIVELVFDHVVPGYLEFHSDLLFHQSKASLFNAFMVGRFCEATLQQGGPWDETDRIKTGAIQLLSDYVGHRPIATLENRRLTIPLNEKIRPVPLYLSGAGIATGPYAEVVELALDILKRTDDQILEAAQFSHELLEELAFDPRSYDFDHPVNRRPNYHFGQWDPDHIDERGHYRRFVVQQVTLDALHQRITSEDDIPREQLVFEAAAVLAGTILMAAGISGRGPGAISTDMALTSLLAIIASYRDEFYDRLLDQVAGDHEERLRQEAEVKRQAFGAARQHINAELARQRASQLEHVHLARVFARMGYLDDAQREAGVVPVASARMTCLIDCSLMAGHQSIDERDWDAAFGYLKESVETMHRAVECGALIDPWNILGCDAQFELFHGLENSVHDHRADEIVAMMDRIFELCSRLWNEATAAKRADSEFVQQVAEYFNELARWWHQYATHQVESVDGFDSLGAFEAARHVAECLNLWHEMGGGSGEVGFWASHAHRFDSPTAYALVVEALLEQGDFVASRGLLMHWLSQVGEVPLEQGHVSYFDLSYRWIVGQLKRMTDLEDDSTALAEVWSQVSKWFDYLEANAEEYWQVPGFDLVGHGKVHPTAEEEGLGEEYDEDEQRDLFDAAYEDVVYQDSTNDGIEGSIFEQPDAGLDELEQESRRITLRLTFLLHLARLWKVAALVGAVNAGRTRKDPSSCDTVAEPLSEWTSQASQNRHALGELLHQIHRHPLARPGADHDSMLEYDRQRLVKENLIEQVIGVCVETEDAHQTLLASQAAVRSVAQGQDPHVGDDHGLPPDQACYVEAIAAAMVQDAKAVEEKFGCFCEQLSQQPLLYVPLAKGGDPQKIVFSRVRRMAIQELLVCLPRLGLIESTHQLLELAREMEQAHPVGQGAVTEFDELFRIGFRAMVEAITKSADQWPAERELTELEQIEEEDDRVWTREARLFLAIERLAERALVTWLEHSKTLRLSVLEKVRDRDTWDKLVAFIKEYGGDLFTQRFFNLGNLRAILHQGVDDWIESLKEDPGEYDCALLESLNTKLSTDEASQWLTLILEAVIENYAEYRDYNSTTTQSDRGELLYMLLDFLRLRVRYDRVAWHLKPVIWSHECLVRNGCSNVAKRWRRAVLERIGKEPDRYIERLKRLQQKYAMQMPSVADRVHEKFLMPMRVDRIRAFVEAAIERKETDEGARAIESLRLETRMLTHEPTGSGLEVPRWLASLEDEVDDVLGRCDWEIDLTQAIVPQVIELSESDLFEQLLHMHEELEDDLEEDDDSAEEAG